MFRYKTIVLLAVICTTGCQVPMGNETNMLSPILDSVQAQSSFNLTDQASDRFYISETFSDSAARSKRDSATAVIVQSAQTIASPQAETPTSLFPMHAPPSPIIPPSQPVLLSPISPIQAQQIPAVTNLAKRAEQAGYSKVGATVVSLQDTSQNLSLIHI